MDNVFLGCPTHNGQIESRVVQALFTEATEEHKVLVKVCQTSLLANGCNNLYCDALNGYHGEKFKWFAMLHSDIAPEPFWLDKLIGIAERYEADLLSAVVPIKGKEGVTSTAIGHPNDSFARVTRLTQRQVNRPDWPQTFDIIDCHANLAPYGIQALNCDLLVNTGCMVMRLDREWSDKLYFTINDRIVQTEFQGYVAQVEPEDWFFSKLVNERGGKVMATKAIRLEHIGNTPYPSDGQWGYEVDPATIKV